MAGFQAPGALGTFAAVRATSKCTRAHTHQLLIHVLVGPRHTHDVVINYLSKTYAYAFIYKVCPEGIQPRIMKNRDIY